VVVSEAPVMFQCETEMGPQIK